MRKRNNTIQPNEISESTKASLKTRVISAIVGLIIIIPAIVIGDWYFFAIVAFCTFVANFEIVKCAKKKYSVWLYIVTIFLAFLIVYWPFFRGFVFEHIQPNGTMRLYEWIKAPYLPLTIIFVGAALLFFIVVCHPSLTVKDACYIFSFVILVCLGMQSIMYLRYIPSQVHSSLNGGPNSNYFNIFDNFEASSLFIYAMIGTFMTDTGAYFVGIFFGKHKLNERISPKKTVEGCIGGVVISFIFSMAFAFIMAVCKHPVLPGMFDLEHWYHILIVSFIVPLFAVLGDLIFSSIKRFFEIKDFGNIIPGHGGVLDRMDSMIFVFTFIAIYVYIVLNFSTNLEAFIL